MTGPPTCTVLGRQAYPSGAIDEKNSILPMRLPPLDHADFVQSLAASLGSTETIRLFEPQRFEEIGALGVHLSVAEADAGLPWGSLRFIALFGTDIRPLMALATSSADHPRIAGLALDFVRAKGTLPDAAFQTMIGLVQLTAHAVERPAYALGVSAEAAKAAGFTRDINPDAPW